MMADGAIDSSELEALESKDIIKRIGLDPDRFDQVFYEYYEDLLSSAHRLPSGQLELDGVSIGRLFDEIRDPALQKLALRSMLDIVNADRQLNGREAVLIAQAFRHWDIERYEVRDTMPGHQRSPHMKAAEIHLS
jgi:uncharacterized tellurite resistance protein B-like protein